MAFTYIYKSLEGTFPRELTPDHKRLPSPFGKTWGQILDTLEKELRMLNYRVGSVVLLTGHTPYDVNNNGTLRRGSRSPEHPGVVVQFDVHDRAAKRYIPMSFECDTFYLFEANLQAITAAMEALRKVDRYNVTGGGKTNAQYDGYKALPSAEGSVGTKESAAAFLATHSGVSREEILFSPTAMAAAFRKAAQALHPDNGGNQDEFVKLTEARKVLEGK